MKRLQRQKGFTLVELAIVLTIVGLLIGGILKGQQLITNARVTAQMAQAKAIQAATTTFNDTYAGLPGDLTTATSRIPNCGTCTNGNGDGLIQGAKAWDGVTFASVATLGAEPMQFWTDLANANLISGVISLGPATFGQGLPSAKISASAGIVAATLAVAPTGFLGASFNSGIYMEIIGSTAATVGTTTGTNAMTPGQAAQIDRKMDDGIDSSGDVSGKGVVANCMSVPAAGSALSGYAETSNTNDCALLIKITP